MATRYPNDQGNPAGAIPVYLTAGSATQAVGALGSNGLVIPNTIGNEYAATTILPATGTNLVTLVTGAPGYYLTSLGVQIDPLSTLGSSATINLVFSDSSSGTVSNFIYYIPGNVTPATLPANDRIVNSPGFFWNNKVANSSLKVNISTALTAGSARFFVRYGICNYLG